MSNYAVVMESGEVYAVQAATSEAAMREANRLARQLHGVNDSAVEAVAA